MAKQSRSDVVIVGGVAAGPKTAATLARRLPELKITLFERGDLISYGTCGMPYFASGDINSFEELTQTSYGTPRDTDFFQNTKGFEVITGAEVIAIDRKRKLVQVETGAGGSSFEQAYDKLVLATGANPIRPRFPVADSPLISHFTRPQHAIAFRRAAEQGKIGKVVVVGGGFIGCELAEAAAGLWGMETVLLEKERQLLPGILDWEMAEIVKREVDRREVAAHTGCLVEKIEVSEDGLPLVFVVGSDPIAADYVFLCLGVEPEVTLAKKSGLKIGPSGGIKTDPQMRTSDSDIYAGGDCVESLHQMTGKETHLPLGSLANRHGRVIAENLAGNPVEFPGVLGAVLIKVFDLNAGAVGLSLRAAAQAGFDAKAVWASFPDKPDYYPEVKTLSAKLVYSGSDGRLLGLQAVGNGDICRRIDVFSSFLQRRATLDNLLDFEHGYAPPYSEALDPLYQLASLAQAAARGVDLMPPAFDHSLAPDLHENVFWLDVREPGEAAGLPWPCPGGNLINIPLNDLRKRLSELDRAKRILIICRRGVRSYQAALILKQAGFEDVHIVGGGTQAALS